jgi:hypothetical protein
MKTFSQFIAEAEKRLKSYTVYSGRSPEDAESIKKTGKFSNPAGLGVFGSTNKNVARTYARAGKSPPESGDKNVVQMRVPKSHVTTTEPGYKGRDQSVGIIKNNPNTKAVRIPNTAQSGELKTPSGKRDSKGDHVVMNPDYASSRIVSLPSPTMRAKDKKKRTKIQPKKK